MGGVGGRNIIRLEGGGRGGCLDGGTMIIPMVFLFAGS